jgi:dihydrofolate reductase
MRKLIAAFKTSIDSKIEGAEGFADWVDAWSEDYGLTQQIDACILGAGMYPGYEMYWTAVQNAGDKPLPMTNKFPTPQELAWSKFAKETPHYVRSSKLNSAHWTNTTFIRGIEDISALKQQAGKDIYLMGGARIAASLIDAGLVDELRLIVYPLVVGKGKSLFAATATRHLLQLREAQQHADGRMSLTYRFG